MAFSKSTELLMALKDFGVAYGAAAVPLANGKSSRRAPRRTVGLSSSRMGPVMG